MSRITAILFYIVGATVLSGSPKFIAPGLFSEKALYPILEYGIINEDCSCFVMNQPYDYQTVMKILHQSQLDNWSALIRNRFAYLSPEEEKPERIGVRLSPGLSKSDRGTESTMVMMKVDGVITIGELVLINRFRLNDAALKTDPEFHGDTAEWLMGYFDESYALYSVNDKMDLFLGRINRNFGTPNEYGLILSDNSYSFDHFGFTASGEQFKYSFFTTRLNDMEAIDLKGHDIPIGETAISKRYWSVQRLDWIINPRVQISLSEATIYGGPDQDFVTSYLNPVHFFYAAQRNQKYSDIEMNGFWQVNIFYKLSAHSMLYLDLLADDLIINNTPGINDRELHPDRLGMLVKFSRTDWLTNHSLTSIRYVRIWNETYTSYRTYENYLYFNKAIGFPLNSYEGLSLNHSSFNRFPWIWSCKLEIWRHGDKSIQDPFINEVRDFPVEPVKYGIQGGLNITTYNWNRFEINFKYFVKWESNTFRRLFDNPEITQLFYLNILYQFSFSY